MSTSYKPTKDFYFRLAMEELKRGNTGNVRLIEDTIGKYPIISLKDARKLTIKKLKEIIYDT